MYAILTLAVSIMLATFVTGVANQNHDLASMYQSRTKWLQTQTMAENIQQYHNEHSEYPVTLAALSAAPGFQQTRSLNDSWQGYAISPTITDNAWQFQRAVFFSNDPSKGVDANAYLTNNTCGTGDYATAQSWCGARTGQWFRSETREQYNQKITAQRVRMSYVMQKIADYYSANQSFPAKDKTNTALIDDSIHTLAELSGFIGTANTCGNTTSSTFEFMGIPIDCADMFDIWGRAIGFQYINSKHIVLISETPIYNNDGTRILVAADFDNTKL